jgi:lipopolysaccharide/colanic/teichoic acid biosynthesis glycosyltransferase
MKRVALLLVMAGTAGVVLALGKVHASWNNYDYEGSFRVGWTLTYISALVISGYGVGLPDLPRNWRARLILAATATTIAASAISAIQFFVGDALLPRFVVLGSPLALIPWYAFCSTICSNGTSRAQQRARIVVVGDLSETKPLQDELLDKPEKPACLVDVVGVEDSHPSAHRQQPLIDRIAVDHASVLVLSRQAQIDDGVVSQAASVHSSGIRVRSLLSFYEEWLGRIPIGELERMSLMFDIGEIHRRHYLRLKRLFDLGFAVIGIVAFIVIVPFVVLGNLIGNRGPLFFAQDRAGKNSELFRLIKFRTMKPGGSDHSNEWTQHNDSRVTMFGRALRKTHIDELPQVYNVLRGDLSIVGPRPEQPQYVEWLVERMPFYDMRHMVRPGLTGWAQVKFGYAGDERDALEKLQYDFYYLRHQGLLIDFRIIARTIRSIMGLAGR